MVDLDRSYDPVKYSPDRMTHFVIFVRLSLWTYFESTRLHSRSGSLDLEIAHVGITAGPN